MFRIVVSLIISLMAFDAVADKVKPPPGKGKFEYFKTPFGEFIHFTNPIPLLDGGELKTESIITPKMKFLPLGPYMSSDGEIHKGILGGLFSQEIFIGLHSFNNREPSVFLISDRNIRQWHDVNQEFSRIDSVSQWIEWGLFIRIEFRELGMKIWNVPGSPDGILALGPKSGEAIFRGILYFDYEKGWCVVMYDKSDIFTVVRIKRTKEGKYFLYHDPSEGKKPKVSIFDPESRTITIQRE